MFLSPLFQILNLFNAFFSLSLIALEVYLLRQWWEDGRQLDWYLFSSLCSLFITLFGRYLFLVFFQNSTANSTSDEPRQIHSSESERLETSDKALMNVEYFGPKHATQTLILLHGTGADTTLWYYLCKNLQVDYRLIVLDFVGYGLSEKPKNKDYSLSRYALDLQQIINTCPRPPILVGHSMGSMVILRYCQMFLEESQNRVKSLILLNGTYTKPLKTAIFSSLFLLLEKPLIIPLCYLQSFLAPIFQALNYLSFINGSLHLSVFLTGFVGSSTTRKQLDFAALFGLKNSVKSVAENTLSILKYEVTELLPLLQIPVKLIASSQDKVTQSRASRFMNNHIPGSELAIVQRAGHMGLIEKNQAVIKEFRNFLEKNQLSVR